MKKTLITAAVASVLSSTGAFAHDDVKTSGYIDIIHSNDALATTGEVDFKLDNIRVDVDLTTGAGSSGVIEQAYFTSEIVDGINLKAGTFNNPIGVEGQDAINLQSTTPGQLFGMINTASTTPNGTTIAQRAATTTNANLSGIALTTEINDISLVAGYVNNASSSAGTSSGEALIAVNGNLDIFSFGAGYIGKPNNLNEVIEVNGAVTVADMVDLGAEFVSGGGDDATKIGPDTGYALTASADLGIVSLFGRFDSVTPLNSKMNDMTIVTLNASTSLTDNVSGIFEIYDVTDNGKTGVGVNNDPDPVYSIEFIATFGDVD